MPPNVRHLGHVFTHEHNAFNCTPLAVLNVARDSMADIGFSPATRVFEAAGAAACLITDAWEGIELFLTPDEEVLVARDGQDVADHVRALTPERARAIGQAALQRVLSRAYLCASRRRGRRAARSAKWRAGSKRSRHEACRARPQPVLVVGQRPRDHLSRAAEGVRGSRATTSCSSNATFPGIATTATSPTRIIAAWNSTARWRSCGTGATRSATPTR